MQMGAAMPARQTMTAMFGGLGAAPPAHGCQRRGQEGVRDSEDDRDWVRTPLAGRNLVHPAAWVVNT